jgi:hypothetical protein
MDNLNILAGQFRILGGTRSETSKS